MTRTCLTIAALALLAGCADPPQPSPQQHADRAALDACRTQADRTFAAQNRGDLVRDNNNSGTPFSANYNSGITTTGLGARFQRDNMVNDCIRGQNDANPPDTTGPNAPAAPIIITK